MLAKALTLREPDGCFIGGIFVSFFLLLVLIDVLLALFDL